MKIMSRWLRMLMFGFTPLLCFADPADPGAPEGDPPAGDPPARKSALADDPPADDPPADDPPADDPPADDPPEEVNYAEIELPDGIKLDEKALEHFAPELKALNVDADAAKELFTKFAAYQDQQIAAANEQFNKEWDEDVEVVSKIPKEDLAAAKRARDAFFDESGIKLLEGRLGDVPAIVQALVKIGKAMAEDSFVEGDGVNDVAPPAEDVLYPTMKK